MAQSSTIVTLPQMVDLALNGPEVGAVNFNLLHALLHVMIQQMELLECKVEFRGNDSDIMQNLITISKPGPSVNLTEYVVDSATKARKALKRKGRKHSDTGATAEKRSKEDVAAETGSTSSFDTVVVVEPAEQGVDTPHVSMAVPRDYFQSLEKDVEKMKDQIKELTELPGNMGIIEALKTDKASPVLDMFQILTLTKRVDAAEEGINKMASILEDVAKGAALQDALADMAPPHGIGPSGPKPPAGGGDVEELEKRVETLEDRMDKGFINLLKEKQDELIAFLKEAGVCSGVDASQTANMKFVEDRFKQCLDKIASLDCMFNSQVEVFQNQISDLEKELGMLLEKINAGFPGGAGDSEEMNFGELNEKIAKLEKDIEDMTEKADALLKEKEERELYLKTLVEQVEFLRNIKANREDMEDALAEKADICAVNKKVNYDQFEHAYEELNRNLDDTLAKLAHQEALWQQTLDDVQTEIANKLDKADLRPIKDYVNSKLKQLQDRLKALTALKRDTEAAGTKSKFLRNVNCISCDKDVVMRKEMDPSLFPPKPMLPPTKSMGPYLAYELDALRKQQRCTPMSRNMNHFESVMESARKPKDGDHICNRYCGGSHTVTTPQQRVARIGHFLQQWGLEPPCEEGQVRGTDGQMYKASEVKTPRLDDLVKQRTSIVVHGDILTARGDAKTHRSSAVMSEASKEKEVATSDLEDKKKSATETDKKKSATEVDKKGGNGKGSPRGSKELPGTPKGSKESLKKKGSKASLSQADKPSSKTEELGAIKEEGAQESEEGASEEGASEAPAEGQAEAPAEEAHPAEEPPAT